MARLFHVPLSPFCRKVRLSLAEKKIEVELVEERYWEADPDFLRRNPAAKVPVLKLDGRTMAESAAICEYLEETRPDPALMPADAEGRYEVRRLVGWFDDKFHAEVTSKLLYERVNKKIAKTGYPDSANVKAGAKAIKYHLDYMAWLLDHRRWLAGDRRERARARARAPALRAARLLGSLGRGELADRRARRVALRPPREARRDAGVRRIASRAVAGRRGLACRRMAA